MQKARSDAGLSRISGFLDKAARAWQKPGSLFTCDCTCPI
jgi:hypothetical protein